MQTRETWGYYRAKIKYFLKVQIVPVTVDLLNNEDGKCKIRARERILVSPVRPVVTDPQQNILQTINKKVGIRSKEANCDITVNKNFFVAGEMAYIWVRIDNSDCGHACHLIVKHKHTLKIMQNNRKSSETWENKSEKFFLAQAGEKKEVLLQFQIAQRRRKCRDVGSISHS